MKFKGKRQEAELISMQNREISERMHRAAEQFGAYGIGNLATAAPEELLNALNSVEFQIAKYRLNINRSTGVGTPKDSWTSQMIQKHTGKAYDGPSVVDNRSLGKQMLDNALDKPSPANINLIDWLSKTVEEHEKTGNSAKNNDKDVNR